MMMMMTCHVIWKCCNDAVGLWSCYLRLSQDEPIYTYADLAINRKSMSLPVSLKVG